MDVQCSRGVGERSVGVSGEVSHTHSLDGFRAHWNAAERRLVLGRISQPGFCFLFFFISISLWPFVYVCFSTSLLHHVGCSVSFLWSMSVHRKLSRGSEGGRGHQVHIINYRFNTLPLSRSTYHGQQPVHPLLPWALPACELVQQETVHSATPTPTPDDTCVCLLHARTEQRLSEACPFHVSTIFAHHFLTMTFADFHTLFCVFCCYGLQSRELQRSPLLLLHSFPGCIRVYSVDGWQGTPSDCHSRWLGITWHHVMGYGGTSANCQQARTRLIHRLW